MLRTMRATDGGPSLRIRMIALLVALGMLLAAAPALVHILRWGFGQIY